MSTMASSFFLSFFVYLIPAYCMHWKGAISAGSIIITAGQADWCKDALNGPGGVRFLARQSENAPYGTWCPLPMKGHWGLV